jgi:hypothetical protein
MSASHDISRVVRSWIREEEHDSADHILQVVLSRLDSTPQRRSWWPARRSQPMNRLTTVAVGAAAALALAVVAYQFLPTTSVGPPGPSPTPDVTAAPCQASPPFPTLGTLASGVHCATIEDVPLSFSVQGSGWSRVEGLGYSIEKGEYEPPDGLAIIFWPNPPDNVYSDPCAHTPLSPPPSGTAAGLAAAVAAIPGTDLVSGPSSVDVGGRPAQHVVLKVGEDLGCDPEDAYLWYDDSSGGETGDWRWAVAVGATIQVWVIDVDGTLVWIDAESFEGAGPGIAADIQAVIDSIEFE